MVGPRIGDQDRESAIRGARERRWHSIRIALAMLLFGARFPVRVRTAIVVGCISE